MFFLPRWWSSVARGHLAISAWLLLISPEQQGRALPLRELADELGVSIFRARRVLRVLGRIGLVMSEPPELVLDSERVWVEQRVVRVA